MHPNPFIYLKGLNRIDLEHVIDFLYNGEAYVAQGELNKFLDTAQELQVKGLQSNKDHQSDQNQTLEGSNVESKFPKIDNNYKQAWADLCKAQVELGLAKIEIFFHPIED